VNKSKYATAEKSPDPAPARHELFSLMRQVVSLRKQVAKAELRQWGKRRTKRASAEQAIKVDNCEHGP
jgi:hypothetical protein